jgi:hypothetical protein
MLPYIACATKQQAKFSQFSVYALGIFVACAAAAIMLAERL